MIVAELRFPGEKDLAALLRAEEKSFSHGRATYKVGEEGKRIVVTIEAADATALKTVVSSVTRIVSVYEKAKGV